MQEGIWAPFINGRSKAIIGGVQYDVIEAGGKFGVDVDGIRQLEEVGKARTFVQVNEARAFCCGLADGSEPNYTQSRPKISLTPRVSVNLTSRKESRVGTVNFVKLAANTEQAKTAKHTYDIRLDKKSDRYVIDIDGRTLINEDNDPELGKYSKGLKGTAMKIYFMKDAKRIIENIDAGGDGNIQLSAGREGSSSKESDLQSSKTN